MIAGKRALLVAALWMVPANASGNPKKAGAPAKPTVEVSAFDLAAGKIPAPKGATSVKEGECELPLKQDHWTFDAKKCASLVEGAVELGNVKFVAAKATPLGGTYSVADAGVAITTEPAMASIAVALPGGWKSFSLTSGATSDPAARPIFDGNEVLIWGKAADAKLYELTLSAEARPEARAQPRARKNDPPTCSSEEQAQWCKAPGKGDKQICIDATRGFELVSSNLKKHILLPNKSLSVVVRHAGNHGADIKMQGTRGLFEAGVADYTGGLLKDRSLHQAEGEKKIFCDVTSHATFAPRKPGSADVKIALRDLDDKTKVIAEHTIELEVDTTYAGAIRLGFSSVFGDAVDRAYDSQLAAGSSTREVTSTESGDVNIEVVVGISAYLIDLIAQGGRTYASRPRWSYFAPSPYVAIGVVTPKEDGVRAIPSLHVGLEWEFSKSFAIGVDAVARRVTRLADGLSVGSPVSAMTTITQDRYEWGWSFTFSVSPEFFQFAVGKP